MVILMLYQGLIIIMMTGTKAIANLIHSKLPYFVCNDKIQQYIIDKTLIQY
jgi:hypothetical protein